LRLLVVQVSSAVIKDSCTNKSEMRIRLKCFGFSSLIVLGLLLISCGGEQTVSSPDDPVAAPSPTVTSEPMIVEGQITEVMESWPLQLVVETQTGRYHIQLLEETKIIQEGQAVNPEILKPGMRVQVKGQGSESNQLAMTAEAIEIK